MKIPCVSKRIIAAVEYVPRGTFQMPKFIFRTSTGLFKMTVGVLMICHTQYT